MPDISPAPYWPSSLPRDRDRFTLWYLANGIRGDAQTVTTIIPDRLFRGLWYGPYANDGSFVPGAVPHFVNPMTYSGVDAFVNPNLSFGFSTLGYGAGFLRPQSFDGTHYLSRPYREVQNIGLPVETDGFGNVGIMLPCSGQISQSGSLAPVTLGGSPPSIGGLGSLQIECGSTILWNLSFSASNVVIDTISGPFNDDIGHDVTTNVFADADGGQTETTSVAHVVDYTTGQMAYTGRVVVPVPGAIINPVRTRYNDLGDAFMAGKGIVASTIFPGLTQAPGSFPLVSSLGVDSFSEFTAPRFPFSWQVFVNFEDLPTFTTPTDTPEYEPALTAYPSTCAIGPPAYLWFLDYF